MKGWARVRRALVAPAELDRPAWLVGAIAFMLVLGVAATVFAAILANGTSDKWFDDLWSEVAKAGVGVVAVGVVGGALGALWSSLSARGERLRQERAKVRQELIELFTLYNDAKRVRRILKSQGLDMTSTSGGDESPAGHWLALTELQAQAFHEQMLALTTVQLAFETKARQFGQTDFVGKDTAMVVTHLGVIERYLHDLLKDAWEERAWEIRAGTEVAVVSDSLQSLFRKTPFREGMSAPLRAITGLVNAHVYRGASQDTEAALKPIVAAEDRD